MRTRSPWMRSVPPSAPARKSRPTGPARQRRRPRPAPASNTASPPLPARRLPPASTARRCRITPEPASSLMLPSCAATRPPLPWGSAHGPAAAPGLTHRPPTSSVAPAATCTPHGAAGSARQDRRVLHAPARRQLPTRCRPGWRRPAQGMPADIHQGAYSTTSPRAPAAAGRSPPPCRQQPPQAAQPGLVQPGRARGSRRRRPRPDPP